MESKKPIMLTQTEAAKHFNVPVHAVRRWVKEGKFLYVTTGRKILINEQSMADFLSGK